MLARGKHGKPTSAFPPFPPSLNIPQQRRDIHISTPPTIRPYIKVRLKTPALKPYTWGWAKLNFRSGPSAVAKSSLLVEYPKLLFVLGFEAEVPQQELRHRMLVIVGHLRLLSGSAAIPF